MTHNKTVVDLGWCKFHAEVTDMITDEVFVWVEDVRFPTKTELRRSLALARQLDPRFFVYANVDASNPVHMRFAHHFGFREVRRTGGISVQVWEKDKCKRC